MLNENEYTEIEGRYYPNPQVSLDESLSFIDNLRAAQAQQNQEIVDQTKMLGTDVPSNLGGLVGGESYFTSRYQVPQTEAAVANLRATAQAKALNDVLANEQAMWKKRYNDAYRAYQKRQYDASKTPTTLDYGDLLKKLGYDVNEDDYGSGGNDTADIYDENAGSPYGKVIPMSSGASKWGDPKTGAWYILKSPTEFDARAAASTFAGQNPTDGMSQVVNGKTMIYDAGSDMWYERGAYIFGQGGN